MTGNRSHRGTNPPANLPPEYPTPMNALDRLRAQSMSLTGGRSPDALPSGGPGLQGRCDDFPREAYVRGKTNLKRPEAIVPVRTGARDAAGPPLNVNLTQLTSDASGKCNTSEWMHGWWGHSCGCGEET